MGGLAPIYRIDDYFCEMAVVPPSVAGPQKYLQCASTPDELHRRLGRLRLRKPEGARPFGPRADFGRYFFQGRDQTAEHQAGIFLHSMPAPFAMLNRAEWDRAGRVEACGRPAPLWRSANEPWRICR